MRNKLTKLNLKGSHAAIFLSSLLLVISALIVKNSITEKPLTKAAEEPILLTQNQICYGNNYLQTFVDTTVVPDPNSGNPDAKVIKFGEEYLLAGLTPTGVKIASLATFGGDVNGNNIEDDLESNQYETQAVTVIVDSETAPLEPVIEYLDDLDPDTGNVESGKNIITTDLNLDLINEEWTENWTTVVFDADLTAQEVNPGDAPENLVPVNTRVEFVKPPLSPESIDGGVLVMWSDDREGDYNIYAQMLNSDGTINPTFNPGSIVNGLALPSEVNNTEDQILEDMSFMPGGDDGSSAFAFTYTQTNSEGERDLLLAIIDATGALQFGTPIDISIEEGNQYNSRIALLDSKAIAVSYETTENMVEDLADPGDLNNPELGIDSYAQKIVVDKFGLAIPTFLPDGKQGSNVTVAKFPACGDQTGPKIIGDFAPIDDYGSYIEPEGVYLLYNQQNYEGNNDNCTPVDSGLYLQHLNGNGVIIDDTIDPSSTCNAFGTQINGSQVNGQFQFQPSIVGDPIQNPEFLFYTYEDNTDGIKVGGFTAQCNSAHPDLPLQISHNSDQNSFPLIAPFAVPDASGGAAITWLSDAGAGAIHVLAQVISADDDLLVGDELPLETKFGQIVNDLEVDIDLELTDYLNSNKSQPDTSFVRFSNRPLAIGLGFMNVVWDTQCQNGGPVDTSSITGRKFYDTNADGLMDDNDDPGISGWKINLSGDATDSTTTGAGGLYSFQELAAGDYTVAEVMAQSSPGYTWQNTTPLTEGVLLGADDSATVNFGNVCLGKAENVPSGRGLTIGFWTNKNGQALFGAADLAEMVALNLRNLNGSMFNPANYASFKTWLSKATATNMAYMLSAQLAAMKLNVFNGSISGDTLIYAPGTTSANDFDFTSINDVMAEADVELGLHGLTLDAKKGVPASEFRAYQEALKNALWHANEQTNIVQSGPCPVNYPV